MSAHKDGGAAFPTTSVRINANEDSTDGIEVYGPGMTLRDYFAAAALTGLIASPDFPRFSDVQAAAAFEAADAMLAAREAA